MKIKGKINAIILASGSSKRMGKNKGLMEYNGKTFLENILDKIIEFHFNEILLVTSYKEFKEILSKNENYSQVKVINNYHSRDGISQSIKLGVVNSRSCDGYMFFTIDQPKISSITIAKLLDEFDKKRIIVPVYEESRGMPTIFPKSFQKKILSLEGDVGGRDIIKKEKENVKFIEIDNIDEGKDIDTMEDYKSLL